MEEQRLTVEVTSFSYRRGIPYDKTGNGGGFVFDCRGILNPGRFEKYMMLNGKDAEVVEFFKKNTRIDRFLEHAFYLIDMTLRSYQGREYTNLMINFGCTGGQHRSVYCAEQTAEQLKENHNLIVDLKHLDLHG
jgi:RNase adaptor protein for sRNA GlmZ degradation